MKFITVQSDTDLSNPFTTGHIKVAEIMESFAEIEGLQIAGLLTPYGINCTLTGNTAFFKNVEIQVHRKMENVTTDVIPHRSPYSSIIDLKAEILVGSDAVKCRIDRRGIIRRLRNKLKGYAHITSNDTYVLYSNDSTLGARISLEDLSSLGKIDWLEVNNQRIVLRSLFIPDNVPEFVEWSKAIEGIVKRTSS